MTSPYTEHDYIGAESLYWEERSSVIPAHIDQHVPGIFCTDLDGTLIQDGSGIRADDVRYLQILGAAGWVRVIVTGRSVDSLRRVFPSPGMLPVDYVIFSSGAGIMDTVTERVIRTVNLTIPALKKILPVLNRERLDYMVHDPAPRNTPFHWWSTGRNNPDFFRRTALYADVCKPLNSAPDTWNAPVAQIIVVSPPETSADRHTFLMNALRDFTVIRTTSPLDGQSLWCEIYPGIVSKGLACEWLKRALCIHEPASIAIGNDYNDWDMLAWAQAGYVVTEAPAELKRRFLPVPDTDLTPVASVIRDLKFPLKNTGKRTS
jgi:hydroxymethylpyrimidine pyrophosphatase-like HAD family hydrolase